MQSITVEITTATALEIRGKWIIAIKDTEIKKSKCLGEIKSTNPIGMKLCVMSLSLLSSCQKWYISRGNQTMRAVGRTMTARATRVKYFLLEKH